VYASLIIAFIPVVFGRLSASVLAKNPPITTQYPSVPMNNPFKAIFIRFQEFDNGDPYIRLIDPRGFSTPIENFEIIGRGAPYVIPLFKFMTVG
jgi:hypothetical protein